MYAVQEWRPRFNLSSENSSDRRCGLVARVEGPSKAGLGAEYLVDSDTTRPKICHFAIAPRTKRLGPPVGHDVIRLEIAT